jgi:hypothetical protein
LLTEPPPGIIEEDRKKFVRVGGYVELVPDTSVATDQNPGAAGIGARSPQRGPNAFEFSMRAAFSGSPLAML